MRVWKRAADAAYSDNDLYAQSKKAAGSFSTTLPKSDFGHTIDRVADLPVDLAQSVFDAMAHRDAAQLGIDAVLEFADNDEEVSVMMEAEFTQLIDQLSTIIIKLEKLAGFQWSARTNA